MSRRTAGRKQKLLQSTTHEDAMKPDFFLLPPARFRFDMSSSLERESARMRKGREQAERRLSAA